VDDRFDATEHFVPIGRGKIAERDVSGAFRVLGRERAYDRDVRDTGFRKVCAERAPDEAGGAGHQDLAARR
jgi:hypothetical protein